MSSSRVQDETAHGRMLADDFPENIWGVGSSPTIKLRVCHQADLIISGDELMVMVTQCTGD